jgi:hypothetical protein
VDWYAAAFRAAFNNEIDLDDNMTATLHTSSYAVSRFVDDYVNDLTNELPTAGGYTVGGVSVGAVTRTTTVANSWAVQRANSTAYALGDVVRPATGNTFLYRATTAGTTGASIPTYPTVLGQTVVDGGVTWECYGLAITVFQCTTAPTWTLAGSVTGIRYLVISDRTAGTAAAQALIAVANFVTDQAGGGGPFTLNPHASLGNFHIAHH